MSSPCCEARPAGPGLPEARLRPLDFDTRLLGVRCLELALSPEALAETPATAERLAWAALAQAPRPCLALAKLPAAQWALARGLAARTEAAHTLTEIVFARAAGAAGRVLPAGVELRRRWPAADFLPLAEELEHSRLLLDPRLDRAHARRLWRASLVNHCQGRAHALLVAREQGRPAGLVIVKRPAPNRLDLFLVGVLARYQRRGIGRRLLSAAVAAFGSHNTLQVEALSSNQAACRLYQAAGFQPALRRQVLHLWLEERAEGTC